jgi:hypothetical protein
MNQEATFQPITPGGALTEQAVLSDKNLAVAPRLLKPYEVQAVVGGALNFHPPMDLHSNRHV